MKQTEKPGSSVLHYDESAIETTAMDFQLPGFTWEQYCTFEGGGEIIHTPYPLQPARPQNPLDLFCFAFLAKFTSTTGFVSSFDCGELNLRRHVVRRITAEHDNDYLLSHSIAEDPADAICEYRADEESTKVIEEVPHVWGYILPGRCFHGRSERQS